MLMFYYLEQYKKKENKVERWRYRLAAEACSQDVDVLELSPEGMKELPPEYSRKSESDLKVPGH